MVTSKKIQALPKSYEEGLQELQQLIQQIETGSLPLNQLLTSYERCSQLLQFCRDSLANVENQVKVIEQKLN